MEIGRGAEEGCARCQKPAKMIFSHCCRSTSILHPAHEAVLFGTILKITMPTLLRNLYLECGRNPLYRCFIEMSMVLHSCSALACSLLIRDHLEAGSTTEEFLCLYVSLHLSRCCSGGRRDFPPPAMALHAFATELASIATVTQDVAGLSPLYSGDCQSFQGRAVIEERNDISHCR